MNFATFKFDPVGGKKSSTNSGLPDGYRVINLAPVPFTLSVGVVEVLARFGTTSTSSPGVSDEITGENVATNAFTEPVATL